MPSNHPRISVTLTKEEYDMLKTIASKRHTSMGAVGRDYIIKGLHGQVTQENLEFIVPVIREQLQSVLAPSVERLAKISSKACVQAGAAAYLSAEAILRFVPEERQMAVEDSYEAARKKAVRYLQGQANLEV